VRSARLSPKSRVIAEIGKSWNFTVEEYGLHGFDIAKPFATEKHTEDCGWDA